MYEELRLMYVELALMHEDLRLLMLLAIASDHVLTEFFLYREIVFYSFLLRGGRGKDSHDPALTVSPLTTQINKSPLSLLYTSFTMTY